jgi:transposase
MMKVTTLGIDLAKSIFQLNGVDERGAVVLRRQVTRKPLLPLVAKLPPCLIGREACAGAHYGAREFGQFGHTLKLMSAHFVAPYRSCWASANAATAISACGLFMGHARWCG